MSFRVDAEILAFRPTLLQRTRSSASASPLIQPGTENAALPLAVAAASASLSGRWAWSDCGGVIVVALAVRRRLASAAGRSDRGP